MTSAVENKETFRRFIEEVWNKHDASTLAAYFQPDFVDYVSMPGMPGGLEGFHARHALVTTAFPDAHFEIISSTAEDDKVAVHVRFTGTNSGEFMGAPATGKPVDVFFIETIRFKDGKIAEHWNAIDMMGIMQQLGHAPVVKLAEERKDTGVFAVGEGEGEIA